MKKVMVRYKIKEDKVSENEHLVEQVYSELHETRISGFHYITLKLEDGVSFVHIAFAETTEANDQFSHLPAFRAFQAKIKERCEELPVVIPVIEIGSYNFIRPLPGQANG